MPEPWISIPLAKDWITRLARQGAKIWSRRRDELGGLFLEFGDYQFLARTYIEPECQTGNPADYRYDENEPTPTWLHRVPIRRWLNDFLTGEVKPGTGQNTLFVLSDAGMGKSSLLIMLKLTHLLKFWPDTADFRLLKLGPGTLDELREIKRRRDVVLLLDALDEDPTAWGRIEERLQELLQETKNFRRVVVTCRTQFFPRGGELPLEQPGKIELSGFVCNLLYLSPFSEEQVEEYLHNVYPDRLADRFRRWLTDASSPRVEKARNAILAMKDLRMRPMLLAYVDELAKADVRGRGEHPVYNALVNHWLLREERKKGTNLTREDLWKACRAMAFHLQVTGKQSLSIADLEDLLVDHPDLAHLKVLDCAGRSLLNRRSDGNLRFAHRSIQEFFIAHGLVEGSWKTDVAFRASDQILRFVFSWIAQSPADRLPGFPWRLLDTRDVKKPIPDLESLAGVDLREADLREAYLRGVDFRGADLGGADLSGADLRNADLQGANLVGANLSGAVLRATQVKGAALLDSRQKSILPGKKKAGGQELVESYLAIPRAIDDSGRALLLLDQLRQATYDGDELIALDLAVAAVADRWPETRDAVREMRLRFFDHMPSPSEDLFRWVDTPQDGRIELWREIPAGRFRVGSPEDEEGRYRDEGPCHEVVVKSAFRMAAIPVTNAQFAAFDPGHKPHRLKGVPESELPHHPVVAVNWYQATSYCRWLSGSFPWAHGARLPTEEEWEYACRAGTETRYWSGDSEKDLARVGWYGEGSKGRTHRVGEKPANPWGLYDVHGNVWEWTLSEGKEDYSEHQDGRGIDPSSVDAADLAAASGARRVIRGGSYWDEARDARSAYRIWSDPWLRSVYQGFRVLLPAAPSVDS